MRKRHAMACLSVLCSVLLAACGGGAVGGGGAGAAGAAGPGPEPDASQPPTFSYATYGAWNQAIRDRTFAHFANCGDRCDRPRVPAAPATIESPFGAMKTFDPMVDQWAATWSGPIEGYRQTDLDGSDIVTRRWTGDAVLEIKSTARGEVRFWTENTRYHKTDGTLWGFGPLATEIPANSHDAWLARLSTMEGQKGYFSSSTSGREFYGQFAAAPDGTVPQGAIGHIYGRGHIAAFKVSKRP